MKVPHGRAGRDKTRKRVDDAQAVPRVATAMHTYVRRADIPRGRIPYVVAGASIDGTFYAERVESADTSSRPSVRHPGPSLDHYGPPVFASHI